MKLTLTLTLLVYSLMDVNMLWTNILVDLKRKEKKITEKGLALLFRVSFIQTNMGCLHVLLSCPILLYSLKTICHTQVWWISYTLLNVQYVLKEDTLLILVHSKSLLLFFIIIFSFLSLYNRIILNPEFHKSNTCKTMSMENDSSSSMGPKEVIKKTQEQLLFQILFATQV